MEVTLYPKVPVMIPLAGTGLIALVTTRSDLLNGEILKKKKNLEK